MIKLASWNVNSLKVRLEQVISWLDSSHVDILAIQETKLIDDNFPRAVFEEKGYHVVFSGQKTYNGVAIISRYPFSDVLTDIPDLDDPQRRILIVTVAGFRLINLYVPNGSELTSDKYQYKLDWLQKVTNFIQQQINIYSKIAVVGDFNIAPEDRDVHDPIAWEGSVLVSPAERNAFVQLLQLGFHDSFRNFVQEDQSFSWWDYRAAAFRRNRGLRIDHILLSKELNHLCTQSVIDKEPRKVERPSDHAPVWVALELSEI
ncbi:exodeoxyribonuclease III [Legionella longbeachae]|uniref:Putative exodeoxyribonuclease III XthA n=1 Tax=Legionella longbeachae serogroup 1 (strain NSW150) TaxID=661367 RepID=D3HKM0_LEGLN|nr:exodeoxyribonuclease III [Legionella longbeachae]VEE03503.1 exodeoxyribonuclease III [Legionella oakridgensis]HBD7397780.1 exodeoxyribonuclease III [Legionella pneumophila]EEZ93886.1 exodeoxyribonuclease III [Legionella longbeachae D-4968]UAK46501.1 exodeoxyribonuclease III [Legionella longbeachae]CBJ12986.1 putative exodeoxyribonuclease III XthA [Legionella longbeachae NSW150]